MIEETNSSFFEILHPKILLKLVNGAATTKG